MSRVTRRHAGLRQIVALGAIAERRAGDEVLRLARAATRARTAQGAAEAGLRDQIAAWDAEVAAPRFDPGMAALRQAAVLAGGERLKQAAQDLAAADASEAAGRAALARAEAQLHCARRLERDAARRCAVERDERQLSQQLETTLARSQWG